MEFKLTLDATPTLLDVLNNMVGALRGLSTPAQTHPQAAQQSATPAPSIPQLPPVMQEPAAQPPAFMAPAVPAVPGTPPAAPMTPTAVPAATPPTYTLEQVNSACMPLIDAGRLTELRAILSDRYQADSLQKLTPEQLADFVVIVRGMGVQI